MAAIFIAAAIAIRPAARQLLRWNAILSHGSRSPPCRLPVTGGRS
jgi:hypothetical protein